jgi:hypothetical protein
MLGQVTLCAERARGGGQHQVGVADGCQRDPPGATGEGVADRARCLQGKPGLARPTRAGQGDRPDMGPAQQVGDLGQLRLAAEERRRGHRQVRPVE